MPYSRTSKLQGVILRNHRLFQDFQEIGFEYLLNPETGELHSTRSAAFWENCNLRSANLGSFIGLVNLGMIPIHAMPDTTQIPIYDLQTADQIGNIALDKCLHCFPRN